MSPFSKCAVVPLLLVGLMACGQTLNSDAPTRDANLASKGFAGIAIDGDTMTAPPGIKIIGLAPDFTHSDVYLNVLVRPMRPGEPAETYTLYRQTKNGGLEGATTVKEQPLASAPPPAP